ncbi:MAG: class I SAM-dependent methyltransferase [Vicinamibacterales bacterium]
MQAFLDDLGVICPADRFVALLSNAYHEAESAVYDEVHRELDDAAEAWTRCLESLARTLPASLRVLDIGAGTGFASLQVLRVLGPRIERLVCLDPSAAMLAKARLRLDGRGVTPRFVVGDLAAVRPRGGQFDLVVTNSVLHHVPDVAGFLAGVHGLLSAGGVYVAGHEPSRDHFEHAELRRWGALYRRWRRLRQFTSLTAYRRRWSRSPVRPSVVEATNAALLTRGVISRPLPPPAIRRLIDIHVPSPESPAPGWAQAGLTRRDVLGGGVSACELAFETSYSHIKDARARMGAGWRAVDGWLSRRLPMHGSNFVIAVRHPGPSAATRL